MACRPVAAVFVATVLPRLAAAVAVAARRWQVAQTVVAQTVVAQTVVAQTVVALAAAQMVFRLPPSASELRLAAALDPAAAPQSGPPPARLPF